MGKRFQYYLNDSVKIPRSTIYSRKKRKKENILHQFNKICSNFKFGLQKAPTNQNDNIPNSEGSFDFGDFYPEFENSSKSQSDNDTSFDFLNIEQKNFINDSEKIEFLNISLLTLFYAGKISQTALKLILQLFRIATKLDIATDYKMLSRELLNITNETIDYSKHWFCNKCSKKVALEHSKQRYCLTCDSRLSIFYFIPVMNQIKRLFKKKILPTKTSFNYNRDVISDVSDGEYYKYFKTNLPSNNSGFENNYSMTLNTDGIELSLKSNISVWPVYLSINEIPIQYRFYIDNILIAGLLVSDGKPERLDEFLEPIITDLKMLELGTRIGNQIYRFFVTFGTFDKPARSLILNTISSNGYFGCIKCKQKGHFLQYKNGHHHVFKYEDISMLLRNDENYRTDIEYSKISGLPSDGVKGVSVLSTLKFYKPIESTLIDSMHSIFLGVVKKLFSYWFESSAKEPYSQKKNLVKLDNKLMKIRPPNLFSYAPRSILSHKKWRAHEYMNFIFFYAIPIFFEIMSEAYLQHLINLVISLEQLYCKQIDRKALISVKELLRNFVIDLEILYDSHIMSSGIHELLHLVEMTVQSGPLNNSSCYPFEELNRKLTTMIRGKDLIGDEFIKLWSVSQCLKLYIDDKETENEYTEFICKNFALKSSNYKHCNVSGTEIKFFKKIFLDLSLIETNVKKIFSFYFKDKMEKIFFFERISVGPFHFTISISKNRFCNSFIKKGKEYGQIVYVFKFDEQAFIICKKMIEIDNPFYSKSQSIKSHFFISVESNEYFLITDFHDIKTIFCTKHNDNAFILNHFSSNHFFN